MNKFSLNLSLKMSKILALLSVLLVSTVEFGSGQNSCPFGKP